MFQGHVIQQFHVLVWNCLVNMNEWSRLFPHEHKNWAKLTLPVCTFFPLPNFQRPILGKKGLHPSDGATHTYTQVQICSQRQSNWCNSTPPHTRISLKHNSRLLEKPEKPIWWTAFRQSNNKQYSFSFPGVVGRVRKACCCVRLPLS